VCHPPLPGVARTLVLLSVDNKEPRGREAGASPAQSRYGDRRSQ